MTRAVITWGALLLAASSLGCQAADKRDRERTVITLSTPDSDAAGAITERELRMELARLRFEREGRSLKAAPLPPEVRTAAIERMIERRVLLSEAQRLGVAASTTAIARELAHTVSAYGERELARLLSESYLSDVDLRTTTAERLTVGRLLAEQSHRGVTVTDAEVEAAWAAVPEAQKRQGARLRARQIVVVTEEEGQQALDELKRGQPFAEVALRHSFAPEAARGGDLGWIDRENMPAAFEPLFSLEVGKVSPLVSTEYGFHIFRVDAKEEERARTFEEARPGLQAKLLRAKLEKAEDQYVSSVLGRYKIEKDERALARIE
jgi:peptidyl-prolyl cis-trans isomerase C